MNDSNLKRRVFRALPLWYLCVVLLLLVQLLIALAWSFYGPLGNGPERFLDLVYGSPVSWIGNSFFEDRMSLGNAPLGMGLLLLVVILYAFLGGTIFFLLCKLYRRFSAGNTRCLFSVSRSFCSWFPPAEKAIRKNRRQRHRSEMPQPPQRPSSHWETGSNSK